MTTLPIVHIFVAVVRRSFNTLTTGIALLHHENNWKAEFIEHHSQTLEETTIRLMAACVRRLKTPCSLHIFVQDAAVAHATTQHDKRGPSLDRVWQAWTSFDKAVSNGKHRILGAAQAQPDNLIVQACHSSALSVSYMSADDAIDAALRTAPHLFAVEMILQQEINFPWSIRLISSTPQYTESDGSLPPFVGMTTADRLDNLVTPSQLILIRQAARAADLQGESLEDECQTKLRCRTDDLNTNAAQWFIEHLRKMAAEASQSHAHTATATQTAPGHHNIAAT